MAERNLKYKIRAYGMSRGEQEGIFSRTTYPFFVDPGTTYPSCGLGTDRTRSYLV
jgi:hypothetical protein